MIYYTKFISNIFATGISTDCNIFNNSQANDHDPAIVDDINGAAVFSNPIGIDEMSCKVHRFWRIGMP